MSALPSSCDPAAPPSNVACEFYAYETYGQIASGQAYMEDNAFGGCYAILLANASSVPVSIGVDRKGQAFTDLSSVAFLTTGDGSELAYAPLPGGKLPPGQSAVLFLAGQEGRCPSVAHPLIPTTAPTISDAMDQPKKSLLGYAFHITTNAPVAAFDVFPYSGVATGSTMLVPPRSWSAEHVAVDTGYEGYLQGGFGLVATEDNTTVRITPVQDIAWEDAPLLPAFTEGTRTLNKGELLQMVHKRYNGTAVIADKPVGQWAMHQCFIMGSTAGSSECDNVHQSIPPLSAWGSEYVGVGHRARDPSSAGQESTLFRLVGAANGTVLVYSPSAPAGAPTSISANEEQWVRSSSPFVVRSQDAEHPFLLLAHMTTCAELDAGLGCRGDSEMVPVVPGAQFQASAIFATHPLFPETNLVVIRSKGAAGFADVSIDCQAEPLAGWTPVDAQDRYEFVRIDLSTGNFLRRGTCGNGWHHITGLAPISVTVWQWGTAQTLPALDTQRASLGFTAGSAFLPLNSVHPVAPTGP